MNSLVKERNLYLIVYRLSLCLLIFLFYGTYFSTYGLLIISVGLIINIAFYCLIFFQIEKRYLYLLLIIDLSLNFVLVSSTGQITSPFMIYLLSSLIFANFYYSGKKFYFFALIYIIVCTQLPLVVSEELLPVNVHFQLVLVMLSLFCVIFLSNLFLEKINSWYRQMLRINYAIKQLDGLHSLQIISDRVEKQLIRIFKDRKVFIYWFSEGNHEIDWQRNLYYKEITKRNKYHMEKRKELILTNHTGEKELYYFFPIRGDKKAHEGFILVEDSIHWYELIFLNILSTFLVGQKKKLALRSEFSNSLKQEIRQKLAQDLHDGVAQQLFFLSTKLFQIKQFRNSDPSSTKLNQLIQEMETQIQQCHREVREHIHYLMEGKESYHIVDALQALITKAMKGSNLTIDLVTKGRVIEESFEINDALYRITEEAINNIIKHAKASNVVVLLEVTVIQWTLKIIDDGIGIEELHKGDTSDHFGMKGMKERVSKVQGQLMVRSKPSRGTEIIAIIPRKGVEVVG
ncbi:hypothetical protein H1D32_21410 [Anaerobacillus sp. CMMVII]|uniref:sensor histidine kinase n=1 Tax=Anaerobacillus sp. CMMVII TaxID=2755588 RepID=UPI0021B7F2E1|nr:ATP-binding protein [Anaerobacillus sp. CMMVII]MCT8140018.1 hypothetical protein [Anaerobacillus sp. CMMVII]